jgi:hypothetical protein
MFVGLEPGAGTFRYAHGRVINSYRRKRHGRIEVRRCGGSREGEALKELRVSDSREMAELKAKLKKADTTIAKQMAYIQKVKAGLAEVRARLLKAIRNLEPK